MIFCGVYECGLPKLVGCELGGNLKCTAKIVDFLVPRVICQLTCGCTPGAFNYDTLEDYE